MTGIVWTRRAACLLGLVALAGLLAACNGSDVAAASGSSHTLLDALAPEVANVDAAGLSRLELAMPQSAALTGLTSMPTCGVRVEKLLYATIAADGSPATASGALFLPSGSAAICQGSRPIVLYAHGTSSDRAYDLSNLNDTQQSAHAEAMLLAALFVSQGYIVVAPNYVGYDSSDQSVHPYLVAGQQSQEMLDVLTAAREDLMRLHDAGVRDRGQLFVTGYSEGGYVAMATLHALDARGTPATAAAPMSGPYALEAFSDSMFLGQVTLGATVYTPLITAAYEAMTHGAIDTAAIFTPTYATGIASLLPSNTPLSSLFASGRLPQSALFQASPTGNASLDALSPPSPLFAFGFASQDYLIRTDFRAAYVADAQAHPDGAVPVLSAAPYPAAAPANLLRQTFKANDLRTYVPRSPLLLCGGHADPEVPFAVNALPMMRSLDLAATAPAHALLDIDASSGGSGLQGQGFTPVQWSQLLALAQTPRQAYTQAQAALAASQGVVAAIEAYHSQAAPYCALVARGFFDLYGGT